MADFNRNNRFSRGGGFKRRDFSDRASRGPVEMHRAVCDSCGKECEVPFRPTQGKPIFCSNCFEKNRGSEFQRPQSQEWNPRRSNSGDREMFEAVCDNCGKDCKIPFRPTNGRPVYCSDCFEKGNNEQSSFTSRNEPRNTQQPQYNQQFQELSVKLDKILALLTPSVVSSEIPVESVIEEAPKAEKKRRTSKKTEISGQE